MVAELEAGSCFGDSEIVRYLCACAPSVGTFALLMAWRCAPRASASRRLGDRIVQHVALTARAPLECDTMPYPLGHCGMALDRTSLRSCCSRLCRAGRCALPFSADAIERLYAFVCVASRMLLFACFPRVALQVHGRLTYMSSATSTTDCTLLRISRATFTENLSSHLLDVLRLYCSQVPRQLLRPCRPSLPAGCACELLRHFTAARCRQRLLRCEPERDAR